MRTTGLAASWYASPSLRLRADVYERGLEQGALERSSMGASVSASYLFEPGWTVGGGIGGVRTDGDAGTTRASGELSLTTPSRHPVGATLAGRAAVLDATAQLATTGVRTAETSLSVRWQPASAWRIDGSAGYALYDGTERNTRTSGALSLSRTLGHGLSLGLAGRAFGFDKDLQDGYFDPDFFGIAEVMGRWLGRAGPTSLLLEVAPGRQQATRDGDQTNTIRGSARIAYEIAPGREIALSGGYSSTGLQSFSTGEGDYRYKALILSAGWRF